MSPTAAFMSRFTRIPQSKFYSLLPSLACVQVIASDDSVGAIAHLKKVKNLGKDTSNFAGLTRMWLDFFLLNEANMCAVVRSGFSVVSCATSARRFAEDGKLSTIVTTSDRETYMLPATTNDYPVCDKWTNARVSSRRPRSTVLSPSIKST